MTRIDYDLILLELENINLAERQTNLLAGDHPTIKIMSDDL